MSRQEAVNPDIEAGRDEQIRGQPPLESAVDRQNGRSEQRPTWKVGPW
jgi:hypothetical protein